MSCNWISQGPYIREHDDRAATVATVHTGNAADAKLIAAAPEMAEELARIQGYCPVVVQDRIRALLAKAGL